MIIVVVVVVCCIIHSDIRWSLSYARMIYLSNDICIDKSIPCNCRYQKVLSATVPVKDFYNTDKKYICLKLSAALLLFGCFKHRILQRSVIHSCNDLCCTIYHLIVQ